MKFQGRILIALGLLALGVPASAYYHFLRYQNRVAPFGAVAERFDLAALPGSTVHWFLNDSTIPALAAGDNMTAVLSQMQAAARVWSEVTTSELRFGYGGTVLPKATMNTPWIEVTFDEVPPGLLAMSGPTSRGEIVNGPNGQFVPITKSVVVFSKDQTTRPSYTERFYLTAVHEFGHALGLQHSWTSGVMSTEVTRATTKASPLSQDDVAGISTLYPTAAFRQRTGVITGKVTLEGTGAHLASVVALTANGPAVSALTLPDGSYRIEGVQPGNYYVYAHPLPPPLPGEPEPVNLVLPTNSAGPVGPAPFFDVQFYPFSRVPQSTLAVTAGATLENVDFAVTRRNAQSIHSVQTYSFYAREAVKPAFFAKDRATGSAIFAGYGLVGAGGGPVSGLMVSVIGNLDPMQRLAAYSEDNRYLQLDLGLTPDSVEGHRHLVLTVGNELHVVPSAIRVVAAQPPSITSVTAGTDRTALIAGTQISAATSIWFDGARATVRQMEEGGLRVNLPAAANLHTATVVAMNPDGQSSLFLQGSASPSFKFERSESSAFSFSPNALAAGTEGLVEITSQDGQFAAGSLQLTFGSADVAVKRLWVISPNRALAQVAVAQSMLPATLNGQAVNGLQTQRGAQFFVQPFNARGAYVPLGADVPRMISGGTSALTIANAPASLNSTNTLLFIGDQAAPVTGLSNGQITFQVPSGLATGFTLARLTLNGEPVPPALVRIDLPPPAIFAVQNILGNAFSAASPATPGSLIQLIVAKSSLADQTPRVTTTLADGTVVEHTVLMVQPYIPNQNFVAILTSVAYGLNLTQVPLVVTVGSSSSAPFLLPLRP